MTSRTLRAGEISPNLSFPERRAIVEPWYPSDLWSTIPFNPKVRADIAELVADVPSLSNVNKRPIHKALMAFRRAGLTPADLTAKTDQELMAVEGIGPIGIEVANALVYTMMDVLDELAVQVEYEQPFTDLEILQDMSVRLAELIKFSRFVFDLAVRFPNEQYTELIIELQKITDMYTKMVVEYSHDLRKIGELELNLKRKILSVFGIQHLSQLQARFLPHEAAIMRQTQRVELGEYVYHGIWPVLNIGTSLEAIKADYEEFGAPFGLMKTLDYDHIADPRKIFDVLRSQFAQVRFGSQIRLFGNVARGIGDASFICQLIQQTHPHSSVAWDMYRFSPIKEQDSNPVFLDFDESDTNQPSDIMMVDSFSAGGNSVTSTVHALHRRYPSAQIWVFITQGADWSTISGFTKVAGVNSVFDPSRESGKVMDAVLYKVENVSRIPTRMTFF